MSFTVIQPRAIKRRQLWIEKVFESSGSFAHDSKRVEVKLKKEIQVEGVSALLDHLRLCSAIPESYGHDTSKEKLYSKYTDALISEAYSFIGMNSAVLSERADTADVEVVTKAYSFVADAKAFRLSRTAKNQKDFKIQSLDGWKCGKPFAMVVCPLYQLPSRSSQIYQQAVARNVCILSYSHLAVLAQLADTEKKNKIIKLVHEVFKTVEAMNPSKDASAYWQTVNRTILGYGKNVTSLWKAEKTATVESIKIFKESALKFYANERKIIMSMSHEEAIHQLISVHKIDSRIGTIEAVCENSLMKIF